MSLRQLIAARIARHGPINVADYMSECLLHPQHGYYTTRDPLGASGDFTTAPEISQMFGELIGLALAQAWLDQGMPAPFTLAEAGPGRGTLMADVLRATRQVPGFLDNADIHLIEASPVLRAAQARALADHDPVWHTQVDTLPDQPLFLIANEFFDALPVRQFQRDGARWRERQIGLDNNKLIFGLGDASPQPALAHRLEDTKPGDIVEDCPAAAPIIDAIGRQIESFGGSALIIDYGDWRSLGDTLQAISNHAPQDPLQAPGEADLTAHVDFEALACAAPCACSRLTPQGVFLERLGMTARAEALVQRADPDTRADIQRAHRRLTHPQEMGNLFKVLGLTPQQAAPLPGTTL